MPITFEQIRELVPSPAPVILEIGANDGTDTLRFLECFPRATIHCFEPDPRAAARWRDTVKDTRAHLHQIAIGAADGTATFHQSGGAHRHTQDWDYSGSLRAPKAHLDVHPAITFETHIEVPVRALDSWCAEHGIGEIDFMWADVQGAERDLIAGGAKALARTAYLYTEFDNREMYEGQWRLRKIRGHLPHHEVAQKWRKDVLFARLPQRANAPDPLKDFASDEAN
ncbi:MAG: FkbM family methyltransferase [Pseudomonadota bacterium]